VQGLHGLFAAFPTPSLLLFFAVTFFASQHFCNHLSGFTEFTPIFRGVAGGKSLPYHTSKKTGCLQPPPPASFAPAIKQPKAI